MTFIKPQRQAAPWSQHNFWGQFDAAANLPNTATSDIQVASAELQRGDVAWADSPAPGSLYVCKDPTAGAAVWDAIDSSGGASVQTRQDFYVDADNGSDDNPGTSALPFETIARAVAEIPDVVNADHYIHIRNAPIAGPYAATGLDRIFCLSNGSVIITGEEVTSLYSGTIDAAPTAFLTFTDASQAWADDELVGKSVRFLDGAGANHYRTIVENDGTTFTIAEDIESGAPGAGDAYEIFEPTVEIVFGNEAFLGGSVSASTPFGGAVLSTLATTGPAPIRSVTYANLVLSSDSTRIRQQGYQVSFVGCEIAAGACRFDGVVVCGTKAYSGILTLPDDADQNLEDYVAGWGIFMSGRDGLAVPAFSTGCSLHGYVVRGGVALGISIGASVGVCDLVSGRICGRDASPAAMASIFSGCSVRMGGVVSINRTSTFICKPIAGESPVSLSAICVYPGGSLIMGPYAVIDVTGTGGFGLYVVGGQALFIPATTATELQVAADAGTFAIRITANGTFVFESVDLDQVTVGGVNTNAVGVGPSSLIVQSTTGPAGDFLSDGDFVQGSDGSYIGRENLF